jgi:ribosomal-protein-alanine N-acetyltransferase
MELKTARARLRRLTLADVENMRKLEGNAEVMRFTRPRKRQTPEQTEARLRALLEKEVSYEPFGVWAAELLDGTFVGWFMLVPTGMPFYELGFMMVQDAWGQGLAPEIGARLISYALDELGLPGLSAVTDSENGPSVRVLEKLGFKLKERVRKVDPVLTREVETLVFERKR